MTILKQVTADLDILRGMPVKGLYDYAVEQGWSSRSGFSYFKKALLANGIDYNAVRNETGKQVEKSNAHLVLYSDAKASKDRFAICDKNRQPVWHGRFFKEHEQSMAERDAAEKAVFLASEVAKELDIKGINLTLYVDAQYLTYANAVASGHAGGGKARQLGDYAKRLNVNLNVEWIPGATNPADQYTVCTGHMARDVTAVSKTVEFAQ